MKTTWYTPGEYNAICDRCGFKAKNTELRLTWDGLRVHDRCWEARHPQELIRSVPDELPLPWTRPEGPDDFVQVGFCTASGRQGIADFGQADCAITELDLGYRTIPSIV